MVLSSGPVLPKVTSLSSILLSPSSVLLPLLVQRKLIMRPTTFNREFPTHLALEHYHRTTPPLLSPLDHRLAPWLNPTCLYPVKVPEQNDASSPKPTFLFNLSSKVHLHNLELYKHSSLRSSRTLSLVLPHLLGEVCLKSRRKSVKLTSKLLLTKAARDSLLDRIHIQDSRTLLTGVKEGHWEKIERWKRWSTGEN